LIRQEDELHQKLQIIKQHLLNIKTTEETAKAKAQALLKEQELKKVHELQAQEEETKAQLLKEQELKKAHELQAHLESEKALKKAEDEFANLAKQQKLHAGEIELHEITLKNGGAYDKAYIKKSFEALQIQNPELYSYCHTLYWTLINLIDSYRTLSSGIIKGNLDKEGAIDGLAIAGSKKLASYAESMVKSLAFVGGVIAILDDIIDNIYEKIKENRLNNKVTIIEGIIKAKFTIEEDISICIAKAALYITNAKAKIILQKPDDKSSVSNSSVAQSHTELIKAKLATAKDKIPSDYITQLALEDSVVIMAGLLTKYKEIISITRSLDTQIGAIIIVDVQIVVTDSSTTVTSVTTVSSAAILPLDIGHQDFHDKQEKRLEELAAKLTKMVMEEEEEEKRIEIDERVLIDSGLVDKALIKQKFAEFEKEAPQLHAYCTTFYWVVVNLFGAYRNLSTGLIEAREIETANDKLMLAGAKKLAEYGAALAKGGLLGGAISLLDKVIDSVYTNYKQHIIDNRINNINKVIEAKIGTVDDISLNVAMLAIAMVEAKRDAILHPAPTPPPGKLQAALKWIHDKIEAIKDKVIPSVVLHDLDDHGVQLALQDSTLLIAYLSKNANQIIENKHSLLKELESIVLSGSLEQLLIEAAPSHDEVDALNNLHQVAIVGDHTSPTTPCCHCTIL